MPGPTGSNLLILLERRLDNVVYRAGLAATIWASRQIVGHGHVLVNGKRVDLPSYQVKPGDVVSLSEKMKKNVHVQEWIEEGGVVPPAYMSVDTDDRSATIQHLPERREIPVPVDIQLVVEYYNRLT
jgi:small subunit ribosomal protein S4